MFEITGVHREELQKAYDKALADKEPIFKFHGTEIVTAYAKYLLEYLKSR